MLLAGMSGVAFAVFHALVSGQEQVASLLEVGGRQRSLVQHITIDALQLVNGPGDDRGRLRSDLRRSTAALLAVPPSLDYRVLASPAVGQAEAILYGEPHRLIQQLHDFGDAVEALAGLPDGQLRNDHPLIRKIQALGGGSLLSGSDALVAVLSGGIRERVSTLHLFALGGESLFLLVLLAMYWKVFRPLLRQTDTALAQLAALEDYHRSVVNALADGIMVIDPNRRLVESMNPAAQAIFHLRGGVGQPLDALIPATANASLPQLRRWNRQQVRGYGGAATAPHLDVTLRQAMLDGGDRLIAVVRDITRRVEAEEKAYTLANALEQSAASALITDTEGVILYANPRVCAISGYHKDELLGKTPRILKSGLTAARVYEDLWTRLKAGEEWTGELLNRKKTGELYWSSLAIAPLRDKDGRIVQYLAVMEDVSQRKNMEEALLLAKQQAEQANRSKSDFLASMSHELRTPMNAILGYSEFIEMQPFGPLGHPKYQEYVQDIHESGRHLLELINDMLDLSKVESGKLSLDEEDVDIAPCAVSALRLVAEQASRKNLVLTSDMAPGLPKVWADPLRLKQIVLNLLANAIKFTPDGGTVNLRGFQGEDGRVTLVVKDSGIGIRAEDLPRVLEPFGQVSNPMVRRDEGTGLGLPISKQLAELHGGTFELDSELGVGTTVTVRLPLTRNLPVSEGSAATGD